MKIQQTEDCKVYFSSDPHYGHKNITAGVSSWVKAWPIPYRDWKNGVFHTEDIGVTFSQSRQEFCRANGVRDFATLEDMNEALVSRYNETVRQTDILFILGDVAFGGRENVGIFMDRLICKNVYLIYGNHDHNIRRDENLRKYFKRCDSYMEVLIDGQMVCMFHYSARVWDQSHRGSWFLYGHSHGSLAEIPNARTMDVGVDTNDLYPYSFDELKKIMDKRVPTAIDHHH